MCKDCGQVVDCEETANHTTNCNRSFITLCAHGSPVANISEQENELIILSRGRTQGEGLDMAGPDNDDSTVADKTRKETLMTDEKKRITGRITESNVRDDSNGKGKGWDRDIVGREAQVNEEDAKYNKEDGDTNDKNEIDVIRSPSWCLYSAICGPLPGFEETYEFDHSGRLRHTNDGTKVSFEDLATSSSFHHAEGADKHPNHHCRNHDVATPENFFVVSNQRGDDDGKKSRGRKRSRSSGSVALVAEVLLASERFIANALHRFYDIQRIEIPGPRSALHPRARSPIFVSHRWRGAERLLLIIPRPFGTSPLLWSRSLTLDRGLLHGSVIPLVHGARARGWGVVICNPARNSVKVDVNPDGFAVRTRKV